VQTPTRATSETSAETRASCSPLRSAGRDERWRAVGGYPPFDSRARAPRPLDWEWEEGVEGSGFPRVWRVIRREEADRARRHPLRVVGGAAEQLELARRDGAATRHVDAAVAADCAADGLRRAKAEQKVARERARRHVEEPPAAHGVSC
jgi:hypothetical protein